MIKSFFKKSKKIKKIQKKAKSFDFILFFELKSNISFIYTLTDYKRILKQNN